MVRLAFESLRFDHVVLFKQEHSIFATARECSGKTRIFLVFRGSDNAVYTRNGLISSWEPLDACAGSIIRDKVAKAMGSGIPVFRIDGNSESVVGTVSGN